MVGKDGRLRMYCNNSSGDLDHDVAAKVLLYFKGRVNRIF